MQAEEPSRPREQGERWVAGCAVDLARTASTGSPMHLDLKSSYSKVQEPPNPVELELIGTKSSCKYHLKERIKILHCCSTKATVDNK